MANKKSDGLDEDKKDDEGEGEKITNTLSVTLAC